MKKSTLKSIVLSAMFLALAYVLPFFTGSIPEIGNMLCPMHIPVMICGFICGWQYGIAIGAIAPLLRSFTIGMPPIIPKGVAMSCELAAYGLVAGLLFKLLPKKLPYIYLNLVITMISGRIVWGSVRALIAGVKNMPFPFAMFITDGFVEAIPGIILQFILIPPIIIAIFKNQNKSIITK